MKEIDVKALRERLRMTQQQFASTFFLGIGNVRQWEQKTRSPRGPARVLLLLIDRIPEAVKKALEGFKGNP